MQGHPDRNGHYAEVWRARANWVLAGFALIAGFFLLAEHRAHVLPLLPWLALLACPLMHVLMHGKHGRHRHGDDGNGGTS